MLAAVNAAPPLVKEAHAACGAAGRQGARSAEGAQEPEGDGAAVSPSSWTEPGAGPANWPESDRKGFQEEAAELAGLSPTPGVFSEFLRILLRRRAPENPGRERTPQTELHAWLRSRTSGRRLHCPWGPLAAARRPLLGILTSSGEGNDSGPTPAHHLLAVSSPGTSFPG